MVAGGLDYLVAALRETLEEAGLLLGVDDSGELLGAEAQALLAEWRDQARALGQIEAAARLAALMHGKGWRFAVDRLTPIGHWITPVGMPKRFDTRFLLAHAPADQEVSVDGVEIVEHRWLRPADFARQQQEAGFKVGGPARAVMAELAAHESAAAALAWAARLGRIEPIQPRLARDASGELHPVHPRHPAYAEIGRVDPLGRGIAYSVIRADRPVEIAPGVLRVTADNGHYMTGPGTNSYLLRCGEAGGAHADDWVLIDPGPYEHDAADGGPVARAHQQALLDALPGRLVAILATHTHIDHSPAAAALAARTGAKLYGRRPDGDGDALARQDPSFRPDIVLQGGELLDFGPALSLRVIHTPGHASNHLCFVHRQQRLLFSGDHVMQGSTVVISPPDGSMSAYLRSLEQLLGEATAAGADFDTIAPGHGFLIPEPARLLTALIRHRLQREAKVRNALADLASAEAATLDRLVLRVYDDVPNERHPAARRSLLAHLLRLDELGHARRDGDDAWSPVEAG
jgi:glyoxylase-like metal-dependent hydrolase (beta-lactamase superfamily II)/8-oxo-dGTP pyrophosphatase MutT (NUDIX family)